MGAALSMTGDLVRGLIQPKGGAKIVKVCGGQEHNPLSSLADRETRMGMCLLMDLLYFVRN